MTRLRRALVARVFADWFDGVEGSGARVQRLSAPERRDLRAAMRDVEMMRGWIAMMLAAFGGEVRRDGRVRARPMDGVR